MKTPLIPESDDNDTLTALQANYIAQTKRNAARTTSDEDLVSQVESVLQALSDSANVDFSKREDRVALALSVLTLAFTLNSSLPEELQVSAVESIWQNMEFKSTMVIQAAKNVMETLFKKTSFQSNLSPAAQKFIQLLQTEPLQNRRSLLAMQFLLPKLDSASVERYFGETLFEDLLMLLRDEEVAILVNRIATNLLLSDPEVKRLTADEATPKVQRAVDALVCNSISTDATTSHNTLQHTIPLLLKRLPPLYHHLSTALQAHPASVRKTKASLSLAESGNLAKLSVRPTLPAELLASSLIHSDSSIRITALGLLVKSPSPVTPFDLDDFVLLRTFWKANLGAHEKDVRQKILALFKVQLDRFRASSYAADRDSRRLDDLRQEKESYVKQVKGWIDWLAEEIMWNLSPVAPYRSKNTSLGVLEAMLVSSMHLPGTTSTSWPFVVDLCGEKMTRRLLRSLVSTYEDVQMGSFGLLATYFPTPLPGLQSVETVEEELMQPMKSLMRNVRESEAKSAALLARLVCLKYPVDEAARSVYQEKLLLALIQSAEDQVAFAGKDFGQAAETHPMHGTILAVRQLLPLIQLSEEQGSVIYRRLLKLIEDTWTVTSPLLTNNAEGTVPDHEEARALAMEELGNEDLEDGSATNYKHKSILSTSWRAMREAGALLESVVRTPFTHSLERLQGIWKVDDIRYIGDLFTRFLLLIRHRGAFSAIAPHYAAFYELVSSCKWPEVNALPSVWLDQRLDDLLSSDKYSITRRSAGLPSCIMALLVGTSPFDETLLPRAMDRLLAVATDESGQVSAHVHIHAMNALRVIFLDTSLKKRIMPYVERGFLLAISRFDSDNWAIRNVSLLLYSSLVQRAFSVKRLNPSRSIEAISRRNKTSTFFRTHRSLLPALCDELQRCINSGMLNTQEAGQQSSIYSILLLLSLLQTTEPVQDDAENIERLIDLVDQCSESRIWKIREAAADALVGLLRPSNVMGYIKFLEHLSMVSAQHHPGENAAHGSLLICMRLLEGLACTPDMLFETAFTLNAVASYFLDLKRSPALQNAFLVLCCIWQLVAVSAPINLGNVTRQVDTLLLEYLDSYPTALAAQNRLVATILRFILTENGSSLQHRATDLICSSDSSIMASSIDALTDFMATSETAQLPATVVTALRSILDKGTAQGADRTKAMVLLQHMNPSSDSPVKAATSALSSEYSQTVIVPLKEALLPALASSIASNDQSKSDEIQQVLKWLAATGKYDQSETSRSSSVSGLKALLPAYKRCSEEERTIYLNVLLQALQDDDEDVRGVAEPIAADLLHLESPAQDIVAVGLIYEALSAIEPVAKTQSRVLDTFAYTIDSLPTSDTVLYNVEHPNLYFDRRLTFQLDVKRLQAAHIKIDPAVLLPAQKALQQQSSTLFTSSANEFWVLAANQYKALARLGGATEDDAYGAALRIEDS